MASLIFTMILRICLMAENRRRDRLSKEQYDRESAVQDSCDWVSSYLISLILYPVSPIASSSAIHFMTFPNRYVDRRGCA